MIDAVSLAPRPAHVPAGRVFDFDCFNPQLLDDDIHCAWKRLHDLAPDVFWTPRNGGHWIATRGDDIRRIQLDSVNFSHKALSVPYDPDQPPNPPVTSDPPAHRHYRALIQPAFLPRAIDAMETRARAITRQLIDDIAPRGECEFIGEFAKVLPIALFLEMVDLPYSDRDRLLPLTDAAVRARTLEQRNRANAAMAAYITPYILERGRNPGADLISVVATSRIFDRPIAFEETLSTILTLLFGGLDTVASMLGFVARFLARNPGHCRQLIERPELIKVAIEELIRRHGLINTARLVVNDTEVAGALLKAGDQVQLPNALFGLDERKFDRPMEVDFTRPMPIQLAAFGAGPHICPGAILARRELKVFLEEWLARIPAFTIKPGTTPQLAAGAVQGVHRLELAWPVNPS